MENTRGYVTKKMVGTYRTIPNLKSVEEAGMEAMLEQDS